ncbi:autotransporter beta-domain-containing protein [Campylobacter jejuni subsp. doylei]|nr:autotransporter beta-domain-containing protein [Campylobacter jejuni subsp. doylei]
MKNTLLAKTLGGGVKESPFNSKKIVLSLATISFLASYANATSSGTTGTCPTTSARSGSTDSTYNCTISTTRNEGITLSNYTISNVTLTIKEGGTLGPTNYSSNKTIYAFKLGGNGNPTLTLINQGTIQGKIGIEEWGSSSSNNKTITVKTFENKGTTDGHIYMGGYGTISIENFTNEGTITIPNYNTSGNNHNDGVIYFENSQNGNIHIKTFKNTGTIEAPQGQNSISLKAHNNTTPTLENFINEGFIKGRMVIENHHDSNANFNGTITVKNFENKQNGFIDGDIYMGIYQGNGTISIENFKNSGTINGGERQGVRFQGKDNAKVHIKTFHNQQNGTITSEKGQGVWFQGDVLLGKDDKPLHITLFNNEGFITGGGGDNLLDNDHGYGSRGYYAGGGVVMTSSTIETFKNSGTIKSTGKNNYPGGVKLIRATVNTFENTGLISGFNGLVILKGTIENFTNSGTIESTSQGGGEAAIRIQTAELDPSSITNFTNDGIIKSSSNGVLIESGNKIETLTNKRTIESKLNGIGFLDDGGHTSPDNTELGKIILEEGSSIKARNNGINIDNQTTAKSIKVGGIEVKKGASVVGREAGIYLAKGKEITAPITISGTVSGGNAGIVNEGKMTKGITHDGEGELVISNQGLVGKDEEGNTVTNNKGSVTIKDWVVTTDEKTGKLDTVRIGGTKTEEVKVTSITVDQSNADLEELNDIKNIISGVSTNNIANSIKTNGGGEISLSYDPLSGRLSTDVNLNASISGANLRSFFSTDSKRATFIDNVMANAMQSFSLDSSGKSQKIALSEKGNLYADASDYIQSDHIKNDFTQASPDSNKEHALFILPYASSRNVELSLNEESKGHTKGTIIGYSTLKDSGIYGVYAGYEDTRMGSTYFDVNNISYYAGLKYFNTLLTTAKGQEVYIKAQTKFALIKNDFTKKIGKNEAKAKPHSYAYGINTDWGMNFISDKDIFSPEVGFAYEGSYTEAFSMQDTIGRATVRGGERTYANYLNLFSTKTSFTWFRDWLPNLKTSVELGAKFNINPKVETDARFGNIKVSDEFHLPRVQKFVSTSLIVPLNEAFYFSLNYNGMFDKDSHTHTGFAQFNYLW